MATNNATNTSTPVNVTQGGTGDASFTAYSVVCGGTTSTGALQSVSGVGTSGQLLTSNGAGLLPTWQTGSGGGGISTIDGDTGSATGSTVTFDATTNCGATVSFSASGSTVDFKVSNASDNITIGSSAGNGTLSGDANVSLGNITLSALTDGSFNTAVGQASLATVSSGVSNTAVGYSSLFQLDTGSSNVAIGHNAGSSYTTSESSNIIIGASINGTAGESNITRIGSGQSACYVSGIDGVTVTGTAVLVASDDQLGVAVSSRKYKDNIKDMADKSSLILNLRPVTFTLKDNKDQSIQFGLIAEEVAEIMPEIVINDKNNDPQTVKYHELPALLLNELKKALKRIELLENKSI